MRIEFKELQRVKRHKRVRRKIFGTPEKPRVSLHRSSKNLQCQIISDLDEKTLYTYSTLDKKFKSESVKGGTIEAAKILGKFVSNELKTKGVSKIAFDRAGYRYHGRVKAFADALREGGMNF